MANNAASTSMENKATSDPSRSSSNITILGPADSKDNEKDLSRKSSDSIPSTDARKLTVTVKAKNVKDDAWGSYYHYVLAMILLNNIEDWAPDRYYTVYASRGLLATHFILVMVFVHLPITYMEMLLAQYTKEPPINLWKICPISLGYCYSLIAYSALLSSLDTTKCGINLLYLMETVFDQAPWLRCSPELGTSCLVLTDKTELSMECTVVGNMSQIWCPDRGTFDFSTQHWYKSKYKSESNRMQLDIRWKLVVCSITHWILVILSVMRTIYRFGMLIYVLGFAMLTFAGIELLYILTKLDVITLLRLVFRPPYPSDFFWAVAYMSTIWRAHVTTPPIMMTFAARIESKFNIAWCAITVTFASFLSMFLKTMARRGLRKIMSIQLNVEPLILGLNNANSAMALMPQHFGTLPMPLMWTFYWFTMRYLLLWLKTTMLVQSVLDNLFIKNNVKKEFRTYFISLYCVTGCIINIVIIVKPSALAHMHGIYAQIIFPGTAMMPLIESIIVFLMYGLGVFINDVHFMRGTSPSFFWRFYWKALPFVLMTLYATTLISKVDKGFPPLSTSLWLLRGALLAIIPVFALKQIAYAVYTDNLVWLFNPVFDWGPRDKEVRKARKRFNPETEIRSQPERTVDYVKPRDSTQEDIE